MKAAMAWLGGGGERRGDASERKQALEGRRVGIRFYVSAK